MMSNGICNDRVNKQKNFSIVLYYIFNISILDAYQLDSLSEIFRAAAS